MELRLYGEMIAMLFSQCFDSLSYTRVGASAWLGNWADRVGLMLGSLELIEILRRKPSTAF